MCGRFVLNASPEEIAALFGMAQAPLLVPRYNIAPTQPVGVVRIDPRTHERAWALVHWGLIPSCRKTPASAVV